MQEGPDHRKKVPVRRAIIWKNYFTWAIIGRKCRSEERSSPRQTVSDDWSSGWRVRLSKNNHCHELWTILSLCRQLHITAGVSCWVHRQLEALYCQGQGKGMSQHHLQAITIVFEFGISFWVFDIIFIMFDIFDKKYLLKYSICLIKFLSY